MPDVPLLDAVLSPAANGRLNRLVFISSTSRDLPEERAAVIAACRELGLGVVVMDDFPAEGKGATQASLDHLDRAAVYVGIFAYRYGYREPGHGDRSVTECEYEHAKQKPGFECLSFLLNPRVDWPDERKDPDQSDIERLKKRVSGDVVGWFENSWDLKHQAYRALEQWLRKQPDEPPRGPRQLPAPPADFVGRAGDLEALERHHQGAAIIGVWGPGGSGKTALALKLAERLAPHYPDGQIYLNLRGFNPPPMPRRDALAHVIRSFLGVQHRVPDDDGALQREYRNVLSGRRVLLLLDNAKDAQQVKLLRPPAGTAVVLVTSRHRFVVEGLRPHDLNTLSPTEAVALLRSIAPGLTEDEAGAVATACGHLPLALRLAGSALALRPPHQTVKDYLHRLDDHGRLNEWVPVAKAIRLSEKQLANEVREALRQLATFSGGFEKAWAAALWDVSAPVADDYLAALWNYSLLQWDHEEHLYSLHDLVQEYAQRQLEASARTAAERRHARYFCRLVGGAGAVYEEGSPEITKALELFDRAWPNAEAGFDWAKKHFMDDEEAARLCRDYANRTWYLRELRHPPGQKIEWSEAAAEAARQLKDRQGEGSALGHLGNAYYDLGHLGRAVECHQHHLAFAREAGDRKGEGRALGNLGLAHRALGQLQQAIEFHEQGLAIHREVGDRRSEGTTLGNLGRAYTLLDQPKRAIEFHQQHLAIAREVGDRQGEGSAWGDLGSAYCALGRLQRALNFCQRALAIAREVGYRRGEGYAWGDLGNAHFTLGQTRQALECHQEHLAIAREVGDRQGQTIASWNMGRTLAQLGRIAEAIPFMEVRIAFLRDISHPDTGKCAAHVEELRRRLTS